MSLDEDQDPLPNAYTPSPPVEATPLVELTDLERGLKQQVEALVAAVRSHDYSKIQQASLTLLGSGTLIGGSIWYDPLFASTPEGIVLHATGLLLFLLSYPAYYLWVKSNQRKTRKFLAEEIAIIKQKFPAEYDKILQTFTPDVRALLLSAQQNG